MKLGSDIFYRQVKLKKLHFKVKRKKFVHFLNQQTIGHKTRVSRLRELKLKNDSFTDKNRALQTS